MKRFKRHHFTLLEVLIAVAILTIMMTMLAQFLYSVDMIGRSKKRQSDVFQDQRLLMSLIEDDLRGMVVSSVEGEEIRYQISGSTITFSSNTNLGLQVNDFSALQEIRYSFSSPTVTRSFTTKANAMRSVEILDNVDSFYMQAYGFNDDGDTVAVNTIDSTYPAYVKVYVAINEMSTNAGGAPVPIATREFIRNIYYNRGGQ